MKLNEFLGVKEAAEYLGVSRPTLRKWTLDGKIKSYKNPLSEYTIYKKEELKAILDSVTEVLGQNNGR